MLVGHLHEKKCEVEAGLCPLGMRLYALPKLLFTLRVVVIVVAEHGRADALDVPQGVFPVRLHSYFSLGCCLTQTATILPFQEMRIHYEKPVILMDLHVELI